MYKSDKDYNDISMIFQYFYSAHTVYPKSDDGYNGFLAFLATYRFALAAKVMRVTMILQCFSFRAYR